jgi:geranylgeranyl diphosphate synthase type I
MGAVAPIPASKAPPAALSENTAAIEAKLRRHALAPRSLVGRMTGYHLGFLDERGRPMKGTPGKYLRSSLCLWAARASGGALDQALAPAAAIELVHNFTLIHDDIQDGDLLRRGRPTAWSIWGTSQAINAGDALHALAFRILCQDDRDPARSARLSSLISSALLRVIDGQCLDLALEGRPSTSPLTYFRLIRLKTGALIGAAMEIGAVCAGAPRPVQRAFRHAGELLGLAFQLRDDWLGVWGVAALTGKSNDSDLARHKLTFPVVAAYAEANADQRAAFDRLYAERSEASGEAMRALLLQLGGPDLTAEAARRPAQTAVRVLSSSPGIHPSVVKEFSYVADYIADRNA